MAYHCGKECESTPLFRAPRSSVGAGSAARACLLEMLTEGCRTYPHLEKSADLVKQQHNEWVVASATCHRYEILVLDGLDLQTSHSLMRAGVDAHRIHVPNLPDYDTLLDRSTH